VLRDRSDLSFVQLDRARVAMDDHAEDCLVTGYESLIGSVTLPDPDDRHVLAAAIVAEADVIVTYNLRDFPNDSLDRYKIEAQHPDEFVHRLIDLTPSLVVDVVRAQLASLKNPSSAWTNCWLCSNESVSPKPSPRCANLGSEECRYPVPRVG
jgi:hypothetical protein